MEYACTGLEHMGTISFAHSPAGCPGNIAAMAGADSSQESWPTALGVGKAKSNVGSSAMGELLGRP